jgi:hypothetical protein
VKEGRGKNRFSATIATIQRILLPGQPRDLPVIKKRISLKLQSPALEDLVLKAVVEVTSQPENELLFAFKLVDKAIPFLEKK